MKSRQRLPFIFIISMFFYSITDYREHLGKVMGFLQVLNDQLPYPFTAPLESITSPRGDFLKPLKSSLCSNATAHEALTSALLTKKRSQLQ